MADDRAALHATPRTAASYADEALRIRQDHAAIGRLADELLPALISKLAASGLGEIEVHEGGWKARLRKPAGASESRHAGARPSREQAHAGHAHALGKGGPDARRAAGDADEDADDPIVATSPAVGIYHPKRDVGVGMRVRAGDTIATVDVLGIREDVLAPIDGIVGASFVDAGEAVEYGQQLVRIEIAGGSGDGRFEAGAADRGEGDRGDRPAHGSLAPHDERPIHVERERTPERERPDGERDAVPVRPDRPEAMGPLGSNGAEAAVDVGHSNGYGYDDPLDLEPMAIERTAVDFPRGAGY